MKINDLIFDMIVEEIKANQKTFFNELMTKWRTEAPQLTDDQGEKVFNRHTNIKNQIWKYILLSIFNYLMQILIIKYLFEICSLNFYLSALCASIATMFSGYTIMKLWVFKEIK